MAGFMDRVDAPEITAKRLRSNPFALRDVDDALQLPTVAQAWFTQRWIQYHKDTNTGTIINVPARLRSLSFSPTHYLVLTATAKAIVGKGLKWNEANPTLNKFFKNIVASDKETSTVNDLCYKIAYDKLIFNAFSFYVCFDRGVVTDKIENGIVVPHVDQSKKKIAQLRYFGTEKVRLAIPCTPDGWDIDAVYVSEDWDRWTLKRYTPCRYPLFDVERPIDEHCHVAVYYNRDMRFGANWYPIPDYWAVIPDIINDMLFGKVRYNILDNQAIITMVINQATNKTNEQQNEQLELFEAHFQGANNAGKVLQTFASPVPVSGSPIKADVQFITHADNVGIYTQTQTAIQNNITKAAGVPPALVGENKESVFSNQAALKAAWLLWENLHIKPQREFILNTFREILRFNRNQDPVGFNVSDKEIDDLHFEPFAIDVLLGISDGSIDANPMVNPNLNPVQ